MNKLYNYIISFFTPDFDNILEIINRNLSGKILESAEDFQFVDDCLSLFNKFIPNIKQRVTVKIDDTLYVEAVVKEEHDTIQRFIEAVNND